MVRVNLVFPPQKLNLNGTLQQNTQGFNPAFSHQILSVSVVQFMVQMSKLNGLNKTLLALSLQTNCLRKFRYEMNESSIVQFKCNQILHILTFYVLFVHN